LNVGVKTMRLSSPQEPPQGRGAAAMGVGGVALGTALSSAAGYGLTAGLGLPSFDAALFAAVPVTLVVTTLLAAAISARRAASIDPQRALRQD